MTFLSKYRLILIPCLIAGTFSITGCEWDSSDDPQSTNTEQSDNNSDSGDGTGEGGDTPTTGEEATVSGLAATSEPLEEAEVCLDQNGNGKCESDEPNTVTDSEGRWSITLPDGQLTETTPVIVTTTPSTTLADSGEPADWNYALTGVAEPNFTKTVDGVFISPISTLVENEVANLPSGDRDEAIRNIAGKLGTDVDIFENYLTPPAGSTPTTEDEYDRLQRIADAANELATQIDASIPDNERNNLTEQQIDKLVFDQVNDGLEQIVEEVNKSLVEQPDDSQFDGGDIVNNPEFDDLKQPPDTSEPSPTLTELESRIANAESISPFFEEVGFETYPVVGSQLLHLYLYEVDSSLTADFNATRAQLHNLEVELASLRNQTPPPAPTARSENQIYYEARRRITVAADQDTGIVDIQIGVPSNTDYRSDDSNFQAISESFCDNGNFACDELSTTVKRVRALVWTGFSYRENTIQIGHAGRQGYLPLFSLGEIIANSNATEFASEMNFGEFDLSGLDAVEVIDELVGGKDVPELGSFTFNPDSKGYTFSEKLVTELLLSTWPQAGAGNLCDLPGMPDASITESCNLVYGQISQSTNLPAETFGEILYPISQQDAAYNSLLEDGRPVDALGVTGPTDDAYVARLFGSASNEEGVIRLYRQTESGNFDTLNLNGRWERSGNEAPFERIELFLPSGFFYTDARLGFDLGRSYLFERSGFLRHGWLVPDSVNVDSLFGRQQARYAFNETAFNQIIADLDALGALTEHPYFTRLLIAEMEADIVTTQEAIDSEQNTGGGGGQTE
ncbi:hypothetical protein [Marinobacter salarius]|uniref:Lipoprotein n=1 Tax=Marinobacter salarius TaxID=1420917 RepID=A0A1W6KFE4_9GAMM|nr:hypothetical protein [Marinobacter salarius]ARM86127.1 hypothetical protein MARSALSMR5_04107 [Marinobacter salarius]